MNTDIDTMLGDRITWLEKEKENANIEFLKNQETGAATIHLLCSMEIDFLSQIRSIISDYTSTK